MPKVFLVFILVESATGANNFLRQYIEVDSNIQSLFFLGTPTLKK
jgi:hypothetical protein